MPRAGDQRALGGEPGAAADPIDVIPGLGEDRRRFHQHADLIEARVELDRVVALDRPALGAVPVDLLDSALGIEAVAAHVELAVGAGSAGLWVWTPDDAHNEVALGEAASLRRLAHAAERLVTQHQSLAPGWRPAVLPGCDLAVGAADTQREPVDQQLAGAGRRLLDVHDGRRPRLQRHHGKRTHVRGSLIRYAHRHNLRHAPTARGTPSS